MSDDLKRKRGAIKGQLTNFSKFLMPLQEKTVEEITDLDIIQLKERVDKFESLIHEFNDIQIQVECSYSGDNVEALLEAEYKTEREVFENQFYQNLSQAKRLVNKHNHLVDDNASTNSHVSDNLAGLVKLPKISLPTFGGQNLQWLEFRDTYQSLIHTNDNLSAIQKFHYLRASLEGPPAQILKSLEFSSKNYITAWKCITERYDSPRLLIDYHVKALLNIEPVKKDSSEELRNLTDSLMKNLRALNQLNQPTENWDVLVIALASEKLDKSSKCEWEKYKTTKNTIPKFDEFKHFLKSRAEFLESLEQNVSEKHIDKRKNTSTRGFLATDDSTAHKPSCPVCKNAHYIQNCTEFSKLAVSDRYKKAVSLRLCSNCLRGGHFSKVCRRSTCRICHRKHHTLLHLENMSTTENSVDLTATVETDSKSPNVLSNANQTAKSSETNALSACGVIDGVLLSTAYVNVLDKNQKLVTIRVLLDSGSQSSFMSRNLCERLGLPIEKSGISVKGLNGTVSAIDYKCEVLLKSQYNDFSANICCFVLPKITENLPSVSLDVSKIDIPPNLKLADPTFFQPGQIDMLIGADLFWNLICNGQHILGTNKPVLQKTRLGWIVSGPTGVPKEKSIFCNFSRSFEDNIQKQLSRFWELEECPVEKTLSEEDKLCEKHFIENLKRLPDGRFMVALPLKESAEKLGESYSQAKNRFLKLEKNRLEKDSRFKMLYSDFMLEYLTLGHMKKVTDDSSKILIAYYMPHSGILREGSLTTKLRTVFDASAPTSSGYSLNHLQLPGPILQQNLFSILVRFRQHSIVIAADIEKMYRQVRITPNQLALQRILWRANPSEPLEAYELQTVTYGTTSGAYLAIRCLFQLAYENENRFPEFSQIIKSDFYVDDLLTGAESVDEAVRICKGVSDILRQGCFNLRKFYSNSPEVLTYIPDNNEEAKIIIFGEDEAAKTLGLIWRPSSDHLMYKINLKEPNEPVTKRVILSKISQVFDPLGLLSPCVIIGKILLQKIWLEKLSWDESLPLHMHTAWSNFRDELPLLNTLTIDRHVICKDAKRVEIHGFSDASESAFGGCVYIRSVDKNNCVTVKLLCAKTKVSPLKTVTMPRLELCGALVLARLVDQVTKSLRITLDEKIFWSDSTVVLGWLKTEPSKVKSFVSNRVAEIQDLTSTCVWRHVPTGTNPADILSRGAKPSEIINLKLWWSGPEWLQHSKSEWPNSKSVTIDLPDLRKTDKTFSFHQGMEKSLFSRFSKLPKLIAVTAYMLRFINNCRKAKTERVVGSLY